MKPEPLPRGVLAANGLVLIEGLLRILRMAGDTYGQDYEATLIYWSVVIASVGRYLRNDDLAILMDGGGPLPEEAHHPISARAIAEATGLPRETVRRKIAALVADGHLVHDAKGVHTRPGLLEQRDNAAFVVSAVREIRRMSTSMDMLAHKYEGAFAKPEQP